MYSSLLYICFRENDWKKINEVLNYIPVPPTPLELCIEEIDKESVWIDEYGVGAGDYINLNVLKEILKKYIKNE